MPAKKGEKNPQCTPEQRADIVKRVCALYESQNATIESCCDAAGVQYRTFMLWLAENSEHAELYKKAKGVAGENFFDNVLVPKAMTATELLLMEREIEEYKDEDVVHQGIKSKDADGATLTKGTKTRTKQQPNATTAIFIMKAAFPEKFKDRHEHSGEIATTLKLEALTLEEKLKMVEILKKANGGECYK